MLSQPLRAAATYVPGTPGNPRVRLDFPVIQLEAAYGAPAASDHPRLMLREISRALTAAGLSSVRPGEYRSETDSVELFVGVEDPGDWDIRYRVPALVAIRQLPEFPAGVEFISN